MKTMGLITLLFSATLFAAPAEAGLLDRLLPVEQIGTVVPVEQLEEGRQRRQHIRSMHILERPNRTIHVYGNFVRYRHAHGNSILY